MRKSTTIYLATGTNIGDREQNLAKANRQIEKQIGTILSASSLYNTKAWGVIDQADFYNQVLKVETSLSPKSLIETILSIEIEMGRFREIKWGSRLIDIDVLFYGSEIIDLENLKVPHPQIPFRNFVLVPLNEIAPALVHPTLHLSVEELLINSPDSLEVFQLVNS